MFMAAGAFFFVLSGALLMVGAPVFQSVIGLATGAVMAFNGFVQRLGRPQGPFRVGRDAF